MGEENYFIYVHSMVNELFMYSSHRSTHLFFLPLLKCYKIDVRFHLFFPKRKRAKNSRVLEEDCTRKEDVRF